MSASTTRHWTVISGAALAAALLAAGWAPARAQTVATDARWQAWLGCWAPATRVVPPRSSAATPLFACVVPAAGSSGVDVATVADTQLVTSDRIEATGEHRTFTREGCTGWASAQWSPDGRRVYTRSEYSCAGGLQRNVSGLMAMSASGDWLDVQSVTTGDKSAVRVLRYRAVEPPGSLPAEIAAALARRGPDASLARTAAAAPITTEDVVEASHQVDSAVVEAWLGERGQGFRLNGRRLLALADAGIPGGVIDVMVALSYPRNFTVGAAGIQPAQEPWVGTRDISGAYGYGMSGGWDPYAYYSPYGLDPFFRGGMAFGGGFGCGPFGYSSLSNCGPYGYGAYGFSPYGYGGYGSYGYSPYGYNPYGGYNGWMYGGGLVVIQGTGAWSQPHGKVVNGRGYTQGNAGAGSGRDAQPRERPQPSTTGSGSGSSGSAQPRSSGGSSGGSSSGSGSSGGSSGSSSGGGRTAHQKPPSH